MSYVLVKREEVKQLREKLKELQLLQEDRKVIKVNGSERGLPLCTTSLSLVAGMNECLFISGTSYRIYKRLDIPQEIKKKPYDAMRNAVELLLKDKNLWSEDLAKEIPKSWVKYGDMILFDSKSFVHPLWKKVGDELWPAVCANLNVKRLGRRYGIQPDNFRSPRVDLLWGDDSWVTAVDGHIRYGWDVMSCMFSPGNATERFRISQMDCQEETIVDLYAGVGYFTLPFLVHAKAACVHACEWNPAAVTALRDNLVTNNVASRCCIYEGDNREVCPEDVANRVYMGLIPTCEPGITTACKALKFLSGGILHMHENVSSYRKNVRKTHLWDSSIPSHKPLKSVSELPGKTPCDQCSAIFLSFPKSLVLHHSASFEDESKEDVMLGYSVNLQGKNCDAEWSKSSQIVWKKREWFGQALHFSHIVCTFLSTFHNRPWKVKLFNVHHVKSYAPHIDHLVFDLKCSPVK